MTCDCCTKGVALYWHPFTGTIRAPCPRGCRPKPKCETCDGNFLHNYDGMPRHGCPECGAGLPDNHGGTE